MADRPTEGDLRTLAQDFGETTAALLDNVLPQAPPIDVIRHGKHYVVKPGFPEDSDGQGHASVPLLIEGERVASLEIALFCRLDSTERYLTIESSVFGLSADVDRTPVLRYEYERDMHQAPHAHIHIHAHRGALSHLLSKTGYATPHDMSSLHIPVGGSRFRPCLEDLLQFLISECGFDAKPNWKEHVEVGRERWRRYQVRSIVRGVPTEAVETLRDLGYTIEAPETLSEESEKALRAW